MERAGNRHQSQLAACRKGTGRIPARRFSTTCCRVRPRRRAATASCSGNCTTYPRKRGSFLTEDLQHEVQKILGLAQLPAATSRFLELGMDSSDGGRIRNRLLRQFGSAFTITATAVFDYPTIGSLAEYLAAQTPELIDGHVDLASKAT